MLLATPVVPPAVQARIVRQAPALAYVPTRMGFGYHYSSAIAKSTIVRIGFRNRAGRVIGFGAAQQFGDCSAGMEKSFQLAGNKVYWNHSADGQQAWRCVVGPGGKRVRLVAATVQPPNRFADVGLGRIVASARRIR